MSNKQERVTLKEYYETGDRPSQDHFEQLIDSMIIQRDDQVWITDEPNPKVGIGTETPQDKLHVAGNIRLDGDRLVANRQTGAFMVMNTDNFNGPSIELYGKQHQGRGGLMTFVAGEGARQGFNFLQYSKDGNGQHRWDPRLRITADGKVGIGTENPDSELHVKGGLTLEGDLVSKQGQEMFWIGNQGGGAIELHGNQKTVPDNREGELALIAGNGSKGGIRFLQHQGTGSWLPLMAISKDGKVGIGTEQPSSKLHINNPGGGKTGLRLTEGASAGYVLLSDAQGNAEWAQPQVLNDGDWLFNGNDIYNGNSGNVGIGVSSPIDKLEVRGNSLLKGNKTSLRIEDAITQNMGIGATTSLMLKQASPQGTGAFLETRTDDSVNWYSAIGAKDTRLYIDSGTNHDISLVPGSLHGGDRAGWVNQSKEWYLRGKIAIGNIPNNDLNLSHALYVNGTSNLSGNTRVDGQVDAASYKLNGLTPIVVKRFQPNTGLSGGYNTQEDTSEFVAAVIVGFISSEGLIGGANKFYTYAYTYKSGGKWHVRMDWRSVNDHEGWTFDVMFIRHGLAEIFGNWTNPSYPTS